MKEFIFKGSSLIVEGEVARYLTDNIEFIMDCQEDIDNLNLREFGSEIIVPESRFKIGDLVDIDCGLHGKIRACRIDSMTYYKEYTYSATFFIGGLKQRIWKLTENDLVQF